MLFRSTWIIEKKYNESTELAFNFVRPKVYEYLKKQRKDKSQFKFNVLIYIVYDKPEEGFDGEQIIKTETKRVNVYRKHLIQTKDDITEVDMNFINQCKNALENVSFKGSGWNMVKVDRAVIEILPIKPIRGGTYISLPKTYINPKCGLMNIQNTDEECFRYCMLYHQSAQGKNDERISKLNKINEK